MSNDKQLPICGEIPIGKGDMRGAKSIILIKVKGQIVESRAQYMQMTMAAINLGFNAEFIAFGQCTYYASA